MEQERFISGYCRCLDGSRMVEVILQDGKIAEVDCGYGSCAFAPTCPIAREIDALGSENHGS